MNSLLKNTPFTKEVWHHTCVRHSANPCLLTKKLEKGVRFPLRADLLDHLEGAQHTMLQGYRNHNSRASDDDQGGGGTVGERGGEKPMEFSVGGGVASCHPFFSVIFRVPGLTRGTEFFSLLNIKIHNPLTYSRKKKEYRDFYIGGASTRIVCTIWLNY